MLGLILYNQLNYFESWTVLATEILKPLVFLGILFCQKI